MTKYLQTKTLADRSCIHEVTAIIRRNVEYISSVDEQQSEQGRAEYTRALCAAAIDRLGPGVFEDLLSHRLHDQMEEDPNDLLSAAARVGHLPLLKSVLAGNANVNTVSQYFGTPLHQAAVNGRSDVVLLLIEHGADIHDGALSAACNGHHRLPYRTALQAACLAGQENIVQLLLRPEYGIQALGDDYDKAIVNAAEGGYLNILRLLLENNLVMPAVKLQSSILFLGCRYGHEQIVSMMLDNGIDVNYSWLEGGTLQIAAFYGHEQVVRLLLRRGADQRRRRKQTPLQRAAKRGQERVAQVLLDHGADINDGNCAPVTMAATSGHTHMVQCLLERGARVDSQSKGRNSLTQAARQGHESIVRLLVKYGANVNGTELDGHPPMLYAMMHGHQHVVNALIELGAHPLHIEQAAQFSCFKQHTPAGSEAITQSSSNKI
ncbi:hypothetical protein MMC06_004821 [Schaereria dolodes]|nr:hypothetical protein [Schaereria dolodes]